MKGSTVKRIGRETSPTLAASVQLRLRTIT